MRALKLRSKPGNYAPFHETHYPVYRECEGKRGFEGGYCATALRFSGRM